MVAEIQPQFVYFSKRPWRCLRRAADCFLCITLGEPLKRNSFVHPDGHSCLSVDESDNRLLFCFRSIVEVMVNFYAEDEYAPPKKRKKKRKMMMTKGKKAEEFGNIAGGTKKPTVRAEQPSGGSSLGLTGPHRRHFNNCSLCYNNTELPPPWTVSISPPVSIMHSGGPRAAQGLIADRVGLPSACLRRLLMRPFSWQHSGGTNL